MIKKIFLWILVIAWMGIIFYFSAANSEKSTKQSRAIIERANIVEVYDKNTPQEKEEIIERVDRVLRKAAHASVFLVLSILVCFLIKEYTLNIKTILIISIIVCFLYSCSDELHQLYVPGRSGEVMDVLIDNIGASIGYFMFYRTGVNIWNREK